MAQLRARLIYHNGDIVEILLPKPYPFISIDHYDRFNNLSGIYELDLDEELSKSAGVLVYL
jgi:hypothetical protein